MRNKNLVQVLETYGKNDEETWSSISTHEGSVQQLDFLTQDEKDVFKTAYELDQRWVVEHAADRTPFVCQAQSVNLFLPGDVHKRDLHQIHFMAWKKGVKSLYYCRSKSIQRADKVSHQVTMNAEQLEMRLQPAYHERGENVVPLAAAPATASAANYEECLACQ